MQPLERLSSDKTASENDENPEGLIPIQALALAPGSTALIYKV